MLSNRGSKTETEIITIQISSSPANSINLSTFSLLIAEKGRSST